MLSVVVLTDGTIGKCLTFAAIIGECALVEFQDENGNIGMKIGMIEEILGKEDI